MNNRTLLHGSCRRRLKEASLLAVLISALLVSAQGQPASPASASATLVNAAPKPDTIVAKTENSRTWERLNYSASSSGRIITNKSHYVELATGLHYRGKD